MPKSSSRFVPTPVVATAMLETGPVVCVDGGHAVVARDAGLEAGVGVGGGGVVGVGDQVDPVGDAVGRNLDLVAGDGRSRRCWPGRSTRG